MALLPHSTPVASLLHASGRFAFSLLLALGGLLASHPGIASAQAEKESESIRVSYVTLHAENDVFAWRNDDFHYTHGTHLTIQFENTDPASEQLQGPWDVLQLPHLAYRKETLKTAHFAATARLAQNIYTPHDLESRIPNLADRLYSAWLYFGLATTVTDLTTDDKQRPAPKWQDVWELDAGVVGRAALGKQVQSWFHRLVDAVHPTWVDPMPSEPGLMMNYDRRWIEDLFEVDVGARSAVRAFVVPHVGLRVGSPFTEADCGCKVVAGWNAPRSFTLGDHPYTNFAAKRAESPDAVHASSWVDSPFLSETSLYVFVGVEGRAVLRNTLLDGTLFRKSRRVDKRNLVGDFTAGTGCRLWMFDLLYGLVDRSPEMRSLREWHQFGFFELSCNFAF